MKEGANMKKLDDIKNEIKSSDRFIIDILNEEGAGLKEKRVGNEIASGKCIIHGGDSNNLHVIEKDGEYYNGRDY